MEHRKDISIVYHSKNNFSNDLMYRVYFIWALRLWLLFGVEIYVENADFVSTSFIPSNIENALSINSNGMICICISVAKAATDSLLIFCVFEFAPNHFVIQLNIFGCHTFSSWCVMCMLLRCLP